MVDEDARLSERTWQHILDSIYRANATSDIETFQYEVLSCLRSLTPNYQGSFSLINVDQGIAHSSRPVIVGAEAHLLDKFSNNYDDDPYFSGTYLKTTSHAFRDRDIIPDHVRETSPVWNEIYEPERLAYALRTLLAHDNTIIGEIALFNTKEDGEFSDRDVQISNLLAPHFALKLASLIEEERAQQSIPNAKSIIKESRLTLREQEIIEKILAGLSEQQIASELCISLSTVKKHVYNGYRKLNVSNRIQLKNLFDGQ